VRFRLGRVNVSAGEQGALDERESPSFIRQICGRPNSSAVTCIQFSRNSVALSSSQPTEVLDVDDLRQRLIDVRTGMQQSVNYEAVDQWRRRRRSSITAGRGHFEYSPRLIDHFN